MKRLAKLLISQTPYRIVRDKGANRFQAIETCLRSMQQKGFVPKVVIDAGANVGSFSLAAEQVFPNAKLHLVEPQPACGGPLRALCAAKGFVFHECALAEHVGRVDLSDTPEPSTGAQVVLEPDSKNTVVVSVAASTLDTLFGSLITKEDRTLLKLDLQGYELHALRGGISMLRSVEAILTEVSFFAQAYEPSIRALLSFLDDCGFQLYDIAALAGRTRDNRLRQGDFIFVNIESPLSNDDGWE